MKLEEGWSILGLLTMMLVSIALSIEAAGWADGLGILVWITLGGIFVGLILSKIGRLPGFVAHWISLLLGAGWTAFLGSTLLPAELTWREKLSDLADRLMLWIEIAMGEGQGTDNLVFVLQTAILIWLVSYICTWFTFRTHNVWGAIIPSGFALLANLYYAPPRLTSYLIIYLLCALLLIVRTHLYLQEKEWRAARVSYNPDIGFDFLRDGAIFAVLVIILAWHSPTNALPRLYDLLNTFEEPVSRMQSQFNRLFSTLHYDWRSGTATFGTTLALSGPVNLSDTPIMDVATDGRRYWRAVVYDKYTGRGWVNTDPAIIALQTHDPRLEVHPFELRQEVVQTIRLLQPGTLLYAAPQPLRFSLPTKAHFYPLRTSASALEGTVRLTVSSRIEEAPAAQLTLAEAVPLNASMFRSRTTLREGQTYTVVSSQSVADVQSLREAGDGYPAWVLERYLQLPSSLPQRVRDLAEEITRGYDNAYDKAVAIESTLRQLTYNKRVQAPPPERDAVDHFLFDSREGYCDYYASAFVVLARAVGIPTRLAAGYAQGEYEPAMEAYRVRARDAHSWPEVYFPRYGWVEFEPTATVPVILRPQLPAGEAGSRTEAGPQEQDLDRNLPEDEEQFGEEAGPERGTPPRLGPRWEAKHWLAAALLSLALTGATVLGSLWRRGLQGLNPIERTYERMCRYARLLGIKGKPSQTPYEYASCLTAAVPQGKSAISRITDLYVRERFSDREISPGEREEVESAWRRLQRAIGWRLVEKAVYFVAGEGGEGKGEKG